MHRIGLVGAGHIAEEHAEAYRAIDGVEVAAVAATTPPEAFVDAHTPGALAVEGADSLREVDLDAIDVCTPTPTHRAIVEAAAGDRPVLCEKPLERTLADASALSSRPLTVGHVVRFAPAYRELRAQLRAMSEPAVVRTHRIGPPPDWADWYADPTASGGVLLDLAIHDLDYLRWTLGPVDRVFARRRRWAGGREHATATVRFTSDAIAHVEASWAQPASRAFTAGIEVAGEGYRIEHRPAADAAVRRYRQTGVTRATPVAREAMEHQLAAFVDWVADGGPPPVSPSDAIEAMRIALAADASAERGVPVAPAEVVP